MVESSYQPTKAQLEGDSRVDVGFDEAVDALAQNVMIQTIERPNGEGLTNQASPRKSRET